MSGELAVWVVGFLGLAGAIGSGIKAFLDRQQTRSKAGLDDANAAAILTAAASEMLNPLRKELAQERADHLLELEAERRKVDQIRSELEACTAQASDLRNELAMARVEADALRREREQDRARIRVLEELLNGRS